MSLAIHTSAPLIPLTQMVGGDGVIEVGKAAGTGEPDCFFGWAEVADHPDCKPHHIIWGLDDETIYWIAKTLSLVGHDVVVTAPLDPDNQFGDHAVAEDMPQHYVDAHSH